MIIIVLACASLLFFAWKITGKLLSNIFPMKPNAIILNTSVESLLHEWWNGTTNTHLLYWRSFSDDCYMDYY